MNKKDQHHHRASLKGIKIQKNPYRKSFAVKELERLANEAASKKNPTIPKEWIATRKYKDNTANSLTRCILDYIRFTGNQAERISSTGRVIDNRKSFTDVLGNTRTIGSTKYIPGTGSNGTADISSVIFGKSVKIEVKIGADRQSEAQKMYQQSVERAGGLYVIANSFEQFLNWYKDNFEEGGKL